MNLIICTSPLQVLIAERIIAAHPNESFYGVMITRSMNSKYAYYYRKLSTVCTKSLRIYVPYDRGRLFSYWLSVRLLIQGLCFPRLSKIFISSTDYAEVHFLLHRQRDTEVYTFDDGALNLSPKAFASILLPPPLF